jgi:propionyl-CoA synthetase
VALLVTASSVTAEQHPQIVSEVVQLVRERVGAVAALRQAAIVPALPKTRSGKILRNALRSIADNELVNTSNSLISMQIESAYPYDFGSSFQN